MATSQEIAQKITEFDKGRKSSADVLNEAMTQYGVPEIRTRVSGLRTTLTNTESALNNVDPSVTGRTSRSLVTEAARQRIVNQEREPIAAQYGDQSRALTTESQNLSDQERAAQLLAQGRENDYTVGRNALQSQYNDLSAREQAAIAQANADRAFQLQKEDADRSYRLAASKASSSTSSTPSTAQFLVSAFSGYDPKKGNGYTEKEVIPALQANYNLTKEQAADLAYRYRKQNYGE